MSDQETSGPLSDEDLAILKEWIIQTAVEFLLYGVYATLSLIALYFLLASDVRKNKTSLALFLLATFMLLLSTSIIVLQLEFILVQIPLKGYNPPDSMHVSALLRDMKISDDFFIRLNFLISDGVLVWRSWILYPRRYTVKIVLGFCLLASTICTFVDAGTGTVKLRREVTINDIVTDVEGGKETLLLTFPLLITNVVASILIGYKAWIHREEIKNNLNDSNAAVNKIQKILLLLVESGMIYFVLWLTFTVISVLNTSSTQHSFETYRQVMPMLSALYPVLIILLAAIESGSKDRSKNGLSLSQTMRYGTAGPDLPGEKSEGRLPQTHSHTHHTHTQTQTQTQTHTRSQIITLPGASSSSELGRPSIERQPSGGEPQEK